MENGLPCGTTPDEAVCVRHKVPDTMRLKPMRLDKAGRWIGLVVMASIAPAFAKGPQEPAQQTRFTFTEYHMGISARIVLYAPDQGSAERAAKAAFVRIADLEAKMSDYRPDSEVMKLCAKPGVDVPISDDLFAVLERSQLVAKQTDGAFDITIGPLVQLWRQARRDGKLPGAAALRTAKSKVGWKKLTLNRRTKTARLAESGMRLDLGGIAKGYAGDAALLAMRTEGVSSALVELGGDIVLGDAPPRSSGWKISVPNAASPGFPAEMSLKNCAVSTSGDTEQFVVIDGIRYSHIVNPRTGRGMTTRVQATVVSPNGLTSDPLSTALTILTGSQADALLRNYPDSRKFIKVAL